MGSKVILTIYFSVDFDQCVVETHIGMVWFVFVLFCFVNDVLCHQTKDMTGENAGLCQKFEGLILLIPRSDL